MMDNISRFPRPIGAGIAWAYQDFPSVLGTTLTLTENDNGDITYFDPTRVLGNSAVIVRATDPNTFAYSGTNKFLSTIVRVTSHIGQSVVLNHIPDASWGATRVYYQYYFATFPRLMDICPRFIQEQLINTIGDLFVSDEDIANLSIDAVGNALVDSATVDFTYNATTKKITADATSSGGLSTTTVSNTAIILAERGNFWTINHALNKVLSIIRSEYQPTDGTYAGKWVDAAGSVVIETVDANNIKVTNEEIVDIAIGKLRIIYA